MKRKPKMPATASIHLWPIFSVQMVAQLSDEDADLVKARLDRLVDRGVLARWCQSGEALPDVYYLASTLA